MGIEMIGVLIFSGLLGLDEFFRANAVPIFASFTFLLLWLTGIITVVRRWAGQ